MLTLSGLPFRSTKDKPGGPNGVERRSKKQFSFSEVRWANLLIGLTEIFVALGMLIDTNRTTVFYKVLSRVPYELAWVSSIFLVGILLVYTSLVPNRSMRLIALYLSFSMLSATFFYFLVVCSIYSPIALLFGVYGVFSLILMGVGTLDKRA